MHFGTRARPCQSSKGSAWSTNILKLNLTDQEKLSSVAFTEACTGEFSKVERGRLPE